MAHPFIWPVPSTAWSMEQAHPTPPHYVRDMMHALWIAQVPSGQGKTGERGAWWKKRREYLAGHATGRVKDSCGQKSQVFLSILEEKSSEQRKKEAGSGFQPRVVLPAPNSARRFDNVTS